MIEEYVIKIMLDYFDKHISEGVDGDLADLHEYVDGRFKQLPLVEEVNEALARNTRIFVRREGKRIMLSLVGVNRTVTNEDMRIADKQFRKSFYRKMRELKAAEK